LTVEGGGTAKQVDFLDAVDGDQAQGFFFGWPVLAPEVGADILADFQRQQALALKAEAKFQSVK
jgi:EAL domain-containing protein (putative c-di-GMP-specific phosphodiesterase class I)